MVSAGNGTLTWTISLMFYSECQMLRISYIWWDDDDICFVLDQHTWLNFHSSNSLIQFTDRHLVRKDMDVNEH